MKRNHYITLFAISAALVGCDQADKPPVPHDTVTKEDVKQDALQSARTTKEYLALEKDEFIAATDKKIKELDVKIDELSKKSADYKDDAKVKADQALASLREQRSALGTQFDKLKAASKDAWADTKSAFVGAWDKVQQGFEDAKAKFQ